MRNGCTDRFAVDICITTDWKAMEGVCMIADLLAKSEHRRLVPSTWLTTN